MNKKGDLTAEELLGLILIIIVLGLVGALIFQGFQGGENKSKETFLRVLNDAETLEPGAKGSSLLFLDAETALVYFEPEADNVTVDVDVTLTPRDLQVVFKKPNTCDNTKGCVCLFQENTYEDTGGTIGDLQGTVTPTKSSCRETEKYFSMANCAVGVAEGVDSYTCHNGFVIERLVIDKARDEVKVINTDAHYVAPSRIALQLQREGNTVTVSVQ
ncbi:MAG: hypothetical protein Q8Q01_03135 [archaeon]|nr:hypothetical protein [archaeon]